MKQPGAVTKQTAFGHLLKAAKAWGSMLILIYASCGVALWLRLDVPLPAVVRMGPLIWGLAALDDSLAVAVLFA